MELFERIRYLSEKTGVSLSKIAREVGVPQPTFNQWLKIGSQKNIWEHLPKILDLFPDVRPEWLYIGQEPAFKDGSQAEDTPTRDEVLALKEENERLKAELAEADRLNRQLITRLLIDGVGDKDGAPGIGKAAGGQE